MVVRNDDRLLRVISDKRGVTVLEYALLCVGILLTVLGTVEAVGGSMSSVFSQLSTSM